MAYIPQVISRVGGRRVILAFAGLYVMVAAGFFASQVGGIRPDGEILIFTALMGVSSLVFSYTGYHLPQTSIRSDLYDIIASWCIRALGIMLSIILLTMLANSVDDLVAGFIVLPMLASVAGLGMGYHDARARTRALDAEERRREAERYSQELERYQTIVETVNDGIFVVDEDFNFTLVNDAYTELVGYDREELIGSHSSLVVPEEADMEAQAKEIQRDLEEGAVETKTYESSSKTASGERIDVDWTVAPLPKQDDSGHDRVVVVRDVSERNEREQRLRHQNERLESFAGMLAHELRNPVAIGQIYSQQLSTESDPEAVDYVTEAFDRIENMIDVMLIITQGREAISERTPVVLADAAQEAWEEVDASDGTLEVAIDQTIRADETYVRHLFRNLFENAVEHGGADITIMVGELPTGFYVADNGSGIPNADREAVFGTGYTTASSRGGMGLGLTFVQEMADVYGWTCSASESDFGGAQFEFENVTSSESVPE